MGPRVFIALTLALLALAGSSALAAGASNNHTVLILETSVAGGMNSSCAQAAIALGYDVELANATTWAAKTTADFETYRAIILGDPHSESGRGSTTPIAIAEQTVNIWGPAIDGNMFILGSDPVNHLQWFANTDAIVRSGIGYVLMPPPSQERTGFYLSTSWYYNTRGPNIPVDVLSYFGDFRVGQNTNCWDDIHIVDPLHPAMSGLTDAMLSNWNCTIHALFTEWPANFAPLAIADGLGEVYTAADGSKGTPFAFYRTLCADPEPVAAPDTLWSPNHKMIPIAVSSVGLQNIIGLQRTITCNETPKAPWSVYYEDGADLFHFKLRADRNGGGTGRIYTVTYSGFDVCGNPVSTSVTVVVPHDQSSKNDMK